MLLLRLFCLVIVLYTPLQLLAQSDTWGLPSRLDGRTVTFTQLMEEMRVLKGPTRFKNLRVIFRHDSDKPGMDTRFSKGGPVWEVPHKVLFYECHFDPIYYFVPRGLHFRGAIEFSSCTNVKVIFKECRFDETVRFTGSDVQFLNFQSCEFDFGFRAIRNRVSDYFRFDRCNFRLNPARMRDTFDLDWEPALFQVLTKNDPMELTIERCTFTATPQQATQPYGFVDVSHGIFSNFRMNLCTLNTPLNLSQTEIQNLFMSFGCTYGAQVIADALNVNPLNTKVQWSTLAGSKLSLYDEDRKQVTGVKDVVTTANELDFNKLVSCYATFYQAFREQGNRLAANACYVEWKDLETGYLASAHQRAQADDNLYFSYLMNVFLRDFCAYGTNPLQSIVLSGYVLLLFACIYFIYPDHIGARTYDHSFYGRMRLYALYLTTPATLAQLYLDHREQATPPSPPREGYTRLVHSQRRRLPWVFGLLARERLVPASPKLDLEYRLYCWLDLLPHEWARTRGWQRWYTGLLYGGLVVGLFIALLAMRALDSITLSLNVFSTLGYGNTGLSGIPRYLTVLEGFIGWFLLSIFSVSLISQVIQ